MLLSCQQQKTFRFWFVFSCLPTRFPHRVQPIVVPPPIFVAAPPPTHKSDPGARRTDLQLQICCPQQPTVQTLGQWKTDLQLRNNCVALTNLQVRPSGNKNWLTVANLLPTPTCRSDPRAIKTDLQLRNNFVALTNLTVTCWVTKQLRNESWQHLLPKPTRNSVESRSSRWASVDKPKMPATY